MGTLGTAGSPAADLDRFDFPWKREIPDRLPASVRHQGSGLWTAPPALRQTHFPDASQPLDDLCRFRTPAQMRLIFEEFFNVGAGLALKRRKAKAAPGIEFQAKESASAGDQAKFCPSTPRRRRSAC